MSNLCLSYQLKVIVRSAFVINGNMRRHVKYTVPNNGTGYPAPSAHQDLRHGTAFRARYAEKIRRHRAKTAV